VVAPEPTSAGRRGPELRNTWQRQSSPLGEPEPGAMGHVAVPEPTSVGRRGPELRSGVGAELSKETRPGSTGHVAAPELTSGHVAAPELTSAGRCGPKLQLMWQCVDARSAPCLNLEIVCGRTQSSGCRQQ
jgi:hypothetical protein